MSQEVLFDIRNGKSRYTNVADMLLEARLLGVPMTATDVDLSNELRRRGLWPLQAGHRMVRRAKA